MNETALNLTMTSLVKVLRELLANMEEEELATLSQDASRFGFIMEKRSNLVTIMQGLRQSMWREINLMMSPSEDPLDIENEKDILIDLAHKVGEEQIEILTLRDQILALQEKLEKQNKRNQFLTNDNATETELEKKSYTRNYRPIKRRLSPKKNLSPKKKVLVQIMDINTEER